MGKINSVARKAAGVAAAGIMVIAASAAMETSASAAVKIPIDRICYVPLASGERVGATHSCCGDGLGDGLGDGSGTTTITAVRGPVKAEPWDDILDLIARQHPQCGPLRAVVPLENEAGTETH